ncbi:MAG: type II CAAX endopeptidase family protein [Roseicyclus sp.]
MQYTAHADFVAPARARPALWRVFLGLVVIALIYALGIVALYGILIATSGFAGANAWMERMATAATPTSTLLVLATFVGMGVGPLVAARILHRRSALSLVGPIPVAVRHFLVAAAICGCVYGLMQLIPSNLTPSQSLGLPIWASFLPLALVGIFIQTGAEEVLFRGYLQQQLAARFSSPVIWMVLPSALFAMLHYQPALMGDTAWVMVAAVFLFAILAADLTAQTGSIGAAWGFHFANNTVAILFVAMDGPLSGLSLFTVPMADMGASELRPMLMLDMVITTLTWAAIRFAVTRR